MLENTLGLLFFLRRSRTQSEEASIYLKITVDSHSSEISLKRKWDPERWNARSGRASGTREDARQLNLYLDTILSKVYDARLYLLERGMIVTSTALKNALTGNDNKKLMLLNYFEQHNDTLLKSIGKTSARGTWVNFRTSYRHTKNYILEKYKVSDINMLSLNMEFIKGFYDWLIVRQGLGHNSAIKNISNMRKIVNSGIENGWLKQDPFLKFNMKRKEVDPQILTMEEIQKIAAKEIPVERLARIRDIFIFCCMTGLAFIDVKQLKSSEIIMDSQGETWIKKRRQKTSTASMIPLLPLPLAILERYKDDHECQLKNQVLPVPTNQKYNAYLKEIANICGIDKPLSSHTARFSFGTSVTLQHGVPIETVSKMLGHKSIKQTQHYARILPNKISEDMKMLHKKLKKKLR